MAAVIVVAVEPAVKGSVAVAVAAVDTHSCPLVVEGAVEPLHFAIGLRVVGPSSGVRDAELGAAGRAT